MAALAEFEPFLAAGHSGRGDLVSAFGRLTLLELRRMMTERGVSLDMVRSSSR